MPVIIDGVVERKTSRFLESVLAPMLDFPCFVQVVADHVMAFELAMLQDFHAIVLPHRSTDKRFSTDAFAAIIKTIRGFTASLIYTIDNDKDGSSFRGQSTVHTNSTGGFNFEELVNAIASIVDEPPSAEVLGHAIATVVSSDSQDGCYVQAVELPKPLNATRVPLRSPLNSPLKAAQPAAAHRKRSRKESEGPASTTSTSVPSHPTHHAHQAQVQVQGHISQDQGQGHQATQASYQQYWASWQQHFYQQSQAQAQTHHQGQGHQAHQQHAGWAHSHGPQSSHPTLPPSASSFSHPTHPCTSEHPYPYHYTDGPVHSHQAYQGSSAAQKAHNAHHKHAHNAHSAYAHHHRSDSTTEEACSITSASTSDSTYATEEECGELRLSTSTTESAADLDLEGFDEMLFCMSNSPVPF